ncbi:MAG TPA: PEP/pyruvate-binding domain-containing protein [Solirubrobacteraceae bacterium]|nr:PEP/pyruvate-binding domain-containing protein [Solirubrobacteraceae bacterium]
MRAVEYTRPLVELRSGDEPRYGGKSAALGELLEAGIRVPPGFGLSREAYAAGRAASGDRLTVPADVRAEIAARYEQLGRSTGEPQPPVAVRSSAVGEDSATATFAGQQDTILWVRGLDAVCEAVSACWVSLHSDTASSYRERFGDGREPAMGVTIQLMVDALISGVLFTCNPLTGDPSMIAINASWGLGLSVVGGEVTPDDYLVSKVTGELVRETLGDKRVEYVPDPDRPAVLALQTPADRAAARCLGPPELAALVEVAKAAQACFGSHQDVEWAIARTGSVPDNVFIVQSRPVTTIRTPPSADLTPSRSAISMVMAQFGAAPPGKD